VRAGGIAGKVCWGTAVLSRTVARRVPPLS